MRYCAASPAGRWSSASTMSSRRGAPRRLSWRRSKRGERQAYDQMIALAHRVFPYVEGHKFYCEHWYTNLFFNKIREFGALLAAHGFFAREEDVFQLTHYEVEAAIIDLMTSWSNGSPPRGPERWPQIVSERRAAIAEWARH